MITDQLMIQKLSAEMNELRLRGNQIFLQQHLETQYPEYSSDMPNFRLEKYYSDYGIDYHNLTVQQLVDLVEKDPAYGYLFVETFLPALFEALYTDADYTLLVAYSRNNDGEVITQPYIKPQKMRDTRKKESALAVGETPSTHKLDISAKFQSPDTHGDVIEIPYHTIRACRVPVLSYFLQLFVLNTNSGKTRRVVKVLISGDEAMDVKTKTKVDNSANIIGVRDTNNGFTFRDIKTPCLRMSTLNFPADRLVAPESIIDDVMEIDEFKKPYEGKPIHSFQVSGKNIIPSQGVICEDVGQDRMLLLCQKAGVAEHVRQGLMMEREKQITKQMIVIAWSEVISFMNLMQQAKIVVDRTKAFSSNGFANYMEPYVPE